MSGPSGYIEYQRLIRTEHEARGQRIGNRECKRLARERMDLEKGIVPERYQREVIPNAKHVVRHRQAHEIDPTYQQAAHNLSCTAEECDRCGRQAKKNGPERHTAKYSLEAVQATTY